MTKRQRFGDGRWQIEGCYAAGGVACKWTGVDLVDGVIDAQICHRFYALDLRAFATDLTHKSGGVAHGVGATGLADMSMDPDAFE